MSQRHLFLSVLGTSPYRSTKYIGLDQTPCQTKYIQVARVHALKKAKVQPLVICIFGTQDAKDSHWSALNEELRTLLPEARIDFIDIPKNIDDTANWQLLDRFSEQIQKEDSLYLDISHGFRSQPIVLIAAAQYKAELVGATIKEITYGVFDRERPAQSPTWDLNALLKLHELSHGLALANKRGDFGLLAKQCKQIYQSARQPLIDKYNPKSAEFKAGLEKLKPFQTLHSAFSTLASTLELCAFRQIPSAAQAAIDALDALEHSNAINSELTHISSTLSHARLKLVPLAGPGTLCAAQLHAQLDAAEFLGKHGRMHQAFTAVRETLIDVARLLLADEQHVSASNDDLDTLINCVAAVRAGYEPRNLQIITLWERHHTHLGLGELGPILDRIRNQRNTLNHGHSDGKCTHYNGKVNLPNLDRFKKGLNDSIHALKVLIPLPVDVPDKPQPS